MVKNALSMYFILTTSNSRLEARVNFSKSEFVPWTINLPAKKVSLPYMVLMLDGNSESAHARSLLCY